MTELREKVLIVLAGQSPGYFAYPNAAAFTAVDLDPEDVAGELDALQADGLIEQETIVEVLQSPADVYMAMSEEDRAALEGGLPDPITMSFPGGHRIVDAGRALLDE